MSEVQLQNIAKKGWLGSHSHSHFTLGLLSTKEIKDELEKTKNYLENLTNTEILSVSYPYGSEDACKAPVPQIAKQIGHRLGFTMKRGINRNVENMLALMRFDCNDLLTGKNETAFKNEYSAIYK
jgi:peptidoglycan/xylan/chitin deacetylase (PgdA/CDA1 family)